MVVESYLSHENIRTTDCIVILAPFGQDAPLLAQTLAALGKQSFCVLDMPSFVHYLRECSVGVFTSDALDPDAIRHLQRVLMEQPPWSDVPLILLASQIDAAGYTVLAETLGNVTILQRPLDSASLLTVVKTALRARQKQYEIRDLLAAADSQNARIQGLNDELQEGEARLQFVLEASQIGTWDMDLKTNIVARSLRHDQVFGYDASLPDWNYKRFMAHIHPEDRCNVDTAFENTLATGRDLNFESRIFTADQTLRWIDVRAGIYGDEHGMPLRLIGSIADITERKQAERELHNRQQEIEALNERLKRAMMETHHRVKNSLQLITAFVDMQAGEHNDAVPTAELRHINTQVRTLAAVHDVLTQETKQNRTADFVSSKHLLDTLLPMIDSMATGKLLRYQIEDVRLASKQGTALALITNELVLNAMKHSGNSVEVTLQANDLWVTLTVLDDGPGLGANFDVVEASNTGLALVETLARWDLGGETTYGNRPFGTGAVIAIKFPIAVEEGASH